VDPATYLCRTRRTGCVPLALATITLRISLHDRFTGLRWLKGGSRADNTYNLTPAGEKGFAALGIDIQGTRALRRRFAYPCVDWSERRPHVDGALAAAFLDVALKRKWVVPDLDSRALSITNTGRREMLARFGLEY
jgi:hypothetical protein